MSIEKRLVLFLLLSFGLMWGMNFLFDQMGWLPKPPAHPPAPPQVAQKIEPPAAPETAPAPARVAEAQPAPDRAQPAGVAPAMALVPAHELVLGSDKDRTPGGYHFQVRLEQKGAGVDSIVSSRFFAEIQEDQPRNRPLLLIAHDPLVPPSFALQLVPVAGPDDAAETPPQPPIRLDRQLWEVVRTADGRVVHEAIKTRVADGAQTRVRGQEIRFRTAVSAPAIVVTKTFRLFPGEDGFELELGFESPQELQTTAYHLLGPHGIPIEGEWYTGTFRDAFFGKVQGSGVRIETHSAYDIATANAEDDPYRNTQVPLKFAGIENQYFTVFYEPDLPAAGAHPEAEAVMTTVGAPPEDLQKADIAVDLISKPIAVGPDRPATQRFLVFAGPKTKEVLAAYGAEDLSAYRKGWQIPIIGPLASQLAKYVIAPMLDQIYALTRALARPFGGSRGSYGIAIILLTVTVRLLMFPLSRKQAISAKKMQDLQPLMMELRDKYKDDKERLTKETFALYKQYGVNPVGGCLPALIQLPIFIGLWQALNNSVSLRNAPFLWIENLAAPDMLFKFPLEIPLIGAWLGPYFNVLPLVVVGLMLVQTKLFSPPATTPEMEAQQRMMKYMMIFMMFMFYKVPSGLGLYFITSSLWSIGERKLLPWIARDTSPVEGVGAEKQGAGPGAGGKGGTDGNGPSSGGWLDQQRKKLERLLEEAAKDQTVRRTAPGDGGGGRDKKDRPRPGRRR